MLELRGAIVGQLDRVKRLLDRLHEETLRLESVADVAAELVFVRDLAGLVEDEVEGLADAVPAGREGV